MVHFAAPTTTRTAMWKAAVVKPNLVAKAIAMANGSRKGTVLPTALHYMVNAPTMSMDAALPPFAKAINITGSVCKQPEFDVVIYIFRDVVTSSSDFE